MNAQEWKCPESGTVFRVGDLVTGYYSGVHRITEIQIRIEDGKEISPLVKLEKVLNGKYKPQRGKCECDISYCRHFKVSMLKKQLIEITDTYNSAIRLLS